MADVISALFLKRWSVGEVAAAANTSIGSSRNMYRAALMQYTPIS